MAFSVVVIGTSWGGLAALTKLLGGLPADFPIPIVVVQHRGKESEHLLRELLQDTTKLTVCEIEDKDPLKACTVHLAPSNYHVLIEQGFVSLTTEDPVRFSRPSIDVMFTSAGDVYRSETIGVVMTGANEDGARGLRHIAQLGGRALVQDPKTAEIPIMPAAAIKAVPKAEVLPLASIAPRLVELCQQANQVARLKTV